MKFSLSWLKTHLETKADLNEILETLTIIGLEVEEVQNKADVLKYFVVAKIESTKPHPDADKLKVCTVNIGGKEPLQVVCGAPNAKEGLIGVFAPVGTYVPGIDITLTKAKIRGVQSFGMMCSESELELSNEHDGIIELPGAAGKAVGQSYVEYAKLDDPVIEIAITPNRPDCTGVRGIARDLAAAGLGKLKPLPKLYEKAGDFAAPIKIKVDMPKEDQCAFWGRMVKGVKNKPSPDWLKDRLISIGLTPKNALVDITNFILFDLGRPLHVYDADKAGKTIEARLAKKGETFKGLDEETYELTPDDCVIADENGVLGLAGILGGLETGSTLETKNVFIESAYFDPVRTAMSGRRHNIISDARFRFERGIDPFSVDDGLAYATKLILDICGGQASKVQTAGVKAQKAAAIDFSFDQVSALTGADLAADKSKNILEALGFQVTGKWTKIKVTAPGWRPDIGGPADLVEEIIRIHGLDKIPLTPLPSVADVPRPVLTSVQQRQGLARRALAAGGFVEAICWSFISKKKAELFGGGSDQLMIDNPISNDMSVMRPSLLPGLMDAARENFDKNLQEAALFEVGACYLGDEIGNQFTACCAVRFGSAVHSGAGRDWQNKQKQVDLFEIKSDVMSLLAALGFDPNNFQLTNDVPDWFHPGRAATIQLGPKNKIGTFGQFHPGLLKAMGIKAQLAGFELNLDALPLPKKKTKTRKSLASFDLQPIFRDFAFVVSQDVPAAKVINAITKVDKNLIKNVNLFDVYEGEHVGQGQKSLAFEVTLQPKDKTLVDAEIEALSQKIISSVEKATGGAIRT